MNPRAFDLRVVKLLNMLRITSPVARGEATGCSASGKVWEQNLAYGNFPGSCELASPFSHYYCNNITITIKIIIYFIL